MYETPQKVCRFITHKHQSFHIDDSSFGNVVRRWCWRQMTFTRRSLNLRVTDLPVHRQDNYVEWTHGAGYQSAVLVQSIESS
jgi:hypothetical protein